MTATNHALTGALIAATVKTPELAIPLAFLAHFVMDAVPHFGISEPDVFKRNKNRKFLLILGGDMLVAALMLITIPFLLHSVIPLWLTFFSMLACMSPDLVWGWRCWRFKDLARVIDEPMSLFSSTHKRIQWSETPMGGIVEIVWLCLMVSIIVKSR